MTGYVYVTGVGDICGAASYYAYIMGQIGLALQSSNTGGGSSGTSGGGNNGGTPQPPKPPPDPVAKCNGIKQKYQQKMIRTMTDNLLWPPLSAGGTVWILCRVADKTGEACAAIGLITGGTTAAGMLPATNHQLEDILEQGVHELEAANCLAERRPLSN